MKATAPPRDSTRSPPRRGGDKTVKARSPQSAAPGKASATPATSSTTRGTTSTRPLEELSGFRTRKGVVLLYEPDPLDAWIGKGVVQQPGGALVHAETGGALTRRETKQYAAFCQRHTARNEEARLADKLFHIVDKYLPLQADETRAYIAPFPGEVRKLLPKARKIRDALRRQRGGSTTAAVEQAKHGGEENPRRAEDADDGPPTPTTRGSTTTQRVRMESPGDDKTRETME